MNGKLDTIEFSEMGSPINKINTPSSGFRIPYKMVVYQAYFDKSKKKSPELRNSLFK